jgi:hypothetical protein
MTTWMPVRGWEGFYEVSPAGQVRGVLRIIQRRDGSVQTWRERIIRPTINSTGYPLVRLSDASSGRRLMARVHRLVADAFIPNPAGLPEVNHKDGNKLNPAADNLEWTTPLGNRKHAWDTGLRTREHLPIKCGEENGQARLDWQRVALARERYNAGASIKGLARDFGVNKRTMQLVLRGKSWLPAPPATVHEEQGT